MKADREYAKWKRGIEKARGRLICDAKRRYSIAGYSDNSMKR